jgi:hypothetical protein
MIEVAQAAQGYLRAPTGKLLHRRMDAQQALSIGTTKFYELVNEGKLKIVKIGSASYVPDESLRAYVASLMREAA